MPSPESTERAAEIADSIERNLGVLNLMEPHLGCAKCHGPLVDGACPTCQIEKFEMDKGGKLRRRSDA